MRIILFKETKLTLKSSKPGFKIKRYGLFRKYDIIEKNVQTKVVGFKKIYLLSLLIWMVSPRLRLH